MRSIGILAIVLMLFSCSKEKPQPDVNQKADKPVKAYSPVKNNNADRGSYKSKGPKLFVFGTRSHPCSDGGPNCFCEGDKGICIIFRGGIVKDRSDTSDLFPGQGFGTIRILENQEQVELTILGDYELNTDPGFDVLENLVLSPEIARELGVEKIELLEGSYETDYSTYQHGQVTINANIH